MKLSKRIAAALIALCMLLTVMPAFAATFTNAVGTFPNFIINNDFSSEVAIPGSAPLNGEGSGLTFQIDVSNLRGLGITYGTVDKLFGTDGVYSQPNLNSVAGTPLENIVFSGTLRIKDACLNYTASNTAQDIIFKNGMTVEVKFANLPITKFRANTAKTELLLNFETIGSYFVSGSAKVVDPAAIAGGATTITRDQFIAGGSVTISRSDAANNINKNRLSPLEVVDLKASRPVGDSVTVPTFPEGTLFIPVTKLNSNGASATTSGWGGYTHYTNTSAPSGTFTAPATGTYVPYALKIGFSTDNTRITDAVIGGVTCKFQNTNMPSAMSNNRNALYWQVDTTNMKVSLTAGQSFNVQLTTASRSGAKTAGFALVPQDKAVDANTVMWSTNGASGTTKVTQNDFNKLHDITFASGTAASVAKNVTVNGTSVSVASGDAKKAGFDVSTTDFDGAAINNPTVLDALVKAGVVTTADYSGLVVTLNGLTITGNYDKWVIENGAVITTGGAATTTNAYKVRFVDVMNGKFQVYTDNATEKAVSIIKIKDGKAVTFDKANVSSANPFGFELEHGEKAYVWAIMKPLTNIWGVQ